MFDRHLFNEGDKVEIIKGDKELIGKKLYVHRYKNYTNMADTIYQLSGLKGWFREHQLKKVD